MEVYRETLTSSFTSNLVNFLPTNKSCSLRKLEPLCFYFDQYMTRFLELHDSWNPFYANPPYLFGVRLVDVTNKLRVIKGMKIFMNTGT